MKNSINSFKSLDEMFNNCSNYIFDLILKNVDNKNICNIALSGGKTPKGLYNLLFKEIVHHQLDQKVNFFLTDERCVDASSEDSNFNMIINCATQTNIKSKFFQMYDDSLGVDLSTKNYNILLNENKIDISILGIGEDGHIASIFNSIFFNDTSAVNNYNVEGINHKRISMTMNYMLSIEKNIIIANGKSKKHMIDKIKESSLNLNFPLHYFYNKIKPVLYVSEMYD